jgi:hypothetical protein
MLVVAPALAMPFVSARAQSNLSGQGFGFPSGQFSTRAQGTGGAVGEIDPFSPINPAMIAAFPSRILFFQMEPEYRSVSTNNGTERTTTARYPVVFGAMPIGNGVVMSLSASSLLDRTSTTSFNTTQIINGGDAVPMTTTYRINGGLEDVRLAAGWNPRSWLRVGAGLHGITGNNLISLTQTFEDSVRFAAFSQQRLLGFHGTAASVGFQVLSSQVVAAASARYGGRLRMSAEDTLLSTADVPNQFGASIAYVGIANSAISVRTSHENWSSLGSLGTPGLVGVDAWDTSVGGDFAGPKIGNRIVYLRAGYRNRTLPFQASGKTVTENSYSLGTGTTFANGRVVTDLALIRASRSADLPASEHAWTLSLGLSVRP